MKRCLFVVCLMLATVTHLDGQVIIRERVELKTPLSQTQLSLLPSSTRSLRIEAFWGGSTEGTLEIIHTVVIGGGTQFGCTIPRSRGVGSISYTIPSAPAGRYEIHLNLTGLAQPTQATIRVFLDDLLVAERTATHQAGPLGDPPPLSYQPPYSSRFEFRLGKSAFLVVTDASLQHGGRYEINGDWTHRSHFYHRIGLDVDLRSRDILDDQFEDENANGFFDSGEKLTVDHNKNGKLDLHRTKLVEILKGWVPRPRFEPTKKDKQGRIITVEHYHLYFWN